MSDPVRVAVVGATGRMGAAVVRLAPDHGLRVVRAVGRSRVGEEIAPDVFVEADVTALGTGGFDVAIDFSSPDVFIDVAVAVAAAGAALVSGTTGLRIEDECAREVASRHVAVLSEPNLSLGVHVLGRLVAAAIALLDGGRGRGADAGVDVEIVETHHRKKVDAPSGTALRLAGLAREALGGAALRHGREGRPGERLRSEIGMHAVRGGDVIGDHTVHLLALGERLELTHRATDRDLFAHGALRAAAWLAGKPAGRYTLADVLGE